MTYLELQNEKPTSSKLTINQESHNGNQHRHQEPAVYYRPKLTVDGITEEKARLILKEYQEGSRCYNYHCIAYYRMVIRIIRNAEDSTSSPPNVAQEGNQ